jgi:hypothetical protein
MSTFLTAKPIERSDCVRDGGDLLCAHQRTVCIIRLLYLIYYNQGTIISCWPVEGLKMSFYQGSTDTQPSADSTLGVRRMAETTVATVSSPASRAALQCRVVRCILGRPVGAGRLCG